MARLPRKISGKTFLKAFQRLWRRLTIPVYNTIPLNFLTWIFAEAKVTREEFLKLLE
jgi:hypothetical protein